MVSVARQVRPVSQGKNIDGVLSQRDGSPCAVTPSGLVREDCCLFLDTHNRTLLKRLLMMPYASPAGRWMHLVHRSVSRFVQDRVPDGYGLSLVALSQDRARPLGNLTRVAPDTRRALRALVPYDCSPGKGVHLLKGVRAAAKPEVPEVLLHSNNQM
ncbi:unnamed protein product, partial [Ixodes pacificus]